uniref:TSA: Wollemia nobilis Ref_Wollemi_Transcript_2341_3023 transcribed RNA sequence n=1 Tax=Wollemia nobilis TaxID=56998 RepID=A0A0C9QWY9_9CONI
MIEEVMAEKREKLVSSVPLTPDFKSYYSEEQLLSWLKKKNKGMREGVEFIHEVDVFKCEPWDLLDKCFLPISDKQSYCFSPCDRNYPSGSLTSRATEAGYWKTTGRDRKISSRSTSLGVRKAMVFYKGRPPRGEKTEWLMHEYRLDENESEAGAGFQNAFVLCHVFKASEPGAKVGGHQTSRIEKCDASPDNSSPFLNCSEPVEEIQKYSSLPESGDTLDMLLSIMLDETDSTPPGEDTFYTQVDMMSKSPGSQREFVGSTLGEGDFPQVPADLRFSQPEEMDAAFEAGTQREVLHAAFENSDNSSVDNSFDQDTLAVISKGDFLELNDLEGYESSMSDECIGIQFQSRSPLSSTSQSHQEDSVFDGTPKRIHSHLYKMEALMGININDTIDRDVHCASNYCSYSDSGSENYDNSSDGSPFDQDSLAVISNGDYLELNDLEDCNSSMSDDCTGIQLRPRSSPDPTSESLLQGHLYDGGHTRIRLQVYNVEASVGINTNDARIMDVHRASNYCGDSESGSAYDLQVQQLLLESFAQEKRNAEITTQNGNSAIGAFPAHVIDQRNELSSCQEHDIKGPENFHFICDSAKVSESFSHNLTSMPPAMSVTKQICDSKKTQQACFEGYVLDSAPELVEKGVNLVSENLIARTTPAPCLGEKSISGESLASSGATALLPETEKRTSMLNFTSADKDSISFKLLSKILGGIPAKSASAMDLTASLKSKSIIFGSKDTTYVTYTTANTIVSKGNVEFPGSDMVSRGLRLRANDTQSGGKDKKGELVRASHERSTLFDRLGKRVSLGGSHGSFTVTCISGIAFLIFCFWLSAVFPLFGRIFSSFAF